MYLPIISILSIYYFNRIEGEQSEQSIVNPYFSTCFLFTSYVHFLEFEGEQGEHFHFLQGEQSEQFFRQSEQRR
jgi:hypothetical protein